MILKSYLKNMTLINMEKVIIKKTHNDNIYNYYSVFADENKSFEIIGNKVIEFVELYNLNINNNQLIISGYIQKQENSLYALDLYIGNKTKVEKIANNKNPYGLFILDIDDNNYFEIKINLPFIYNFFASNFYIKFYQIIGNLVNMSYVSPLKIYVRNELVNLLLNSKIKNTLYDEIIIPYSSYSNRADARTLSIVRRLKRDKRVYMNSRYANTHKWLLLSVKMQGIKCSYCNIDYKDYYLKILNEELIEFYDTKAVNNICYYCLGTGYLGAYDFIGYIDAFLQYSTIYDGDSGLVNVGTGFTTSDYPIKLRDYLFGYNILFIVDGAIEVRQFLNYPILYKFSITSLPFNNIMNSVIKNISDNINKFEIFKKYSF